MDADSPGAQGLLLGAIDCGSNAIRMVIAASTGPGQLRQIEYVRAPVRLGTRAFTRGKLDRAILDEAIGVFQRFRALFDQHRVSHYRAVATSAVRNAHNRDILVHRLYHEAGIDLEVIDGDEEARLVRKAVMHKFIGRPSPRLILDLGGGSLEINLRRDDTWRGFTLPVGTVRLLETFSLNGAINHEEAGMVRRYAASLLRTIRLQPTQEMRTAAACGGNAVALAAIFGDHDEFGMPGLQLQSLEDAMPVLLSSSVEERMARYEVRRDRAEVMTVAALVFTTVCRSMRIERLAAPGVGLRDALLLDLSESCGAEQSSIEAAHGKALLTAARTFAQRTGYDTTHGEQVRKLARSIFDQLTDVHKLPHDLGVVLEIAALLHDIGTVVNPRSHHKHSEYLIRWGRIPGLVEPYREMIAIMARTHRKSLPDVAKHAGFAALPKARRTQVEYLVAILRVADGLDTAHRQAFEDVFVGRLGDSIALDLVVKNEQIKALIDPNALLRKVQLFEQIFGHRVTFTVGTAAPTPPH